MTDGDAPLEQRVHALLSSGRADEARVLLEEAVAANPGLPALHANLAVTLQALGRLDDAIASHTRAIELARGELGAMSFNLGTALAAAGRLDEAAAAYQEALAVRPGWAHALDNLGTVRQRQGRTDDAERAYRAALAADPACAAAHYNLGTLLHARRAFDDAVDCYRAALALEPTRPAARALGAALILLGRLDEALAAFEQDVTLAPAPELGTAHRRMAVALRMAGDLTAALAAAEQGCALRPELAGEHEERGTILAALDRLDDAAAAFGEALAREPGNVGALSWFAHLLRKIDRPGEALAAYRRLLDLVPDHPVALHLSAALAGETPPAVPRGYVSGLFDEYADRFDAHLVGELGYRAPEHVRDAVAAVAGDARLPRALDLGCGTGLVGALLRPRVDEQHGVDLSPRMIEQATRRGVYDALAVGDLVEHLNGADEPRYDLVTAADVLIYVGALEPLFAAVRRRLTDRGLFVFSIERLDDGDLRLCRTGRYAHGHAYVERVAAANRLEPVAFQPVDLRLEDGEPVAGLMCTFRAVP